MAALEPLGLFGLATSDFLGRPLVLLGGVTSGTMDFTSSFIFSAACFVAFAALFTT